jgi:hypothetical protein
MAKGIAVVSGSATVRHKIMDNGSAKLGEVGKTSKFHSVVKLGDGSETPNLANRLMGLTGTLETRITTAEGARDDAIISLNVVSASIETNASYTLPTHTLNVVDASGNENTYAATSLVDADKKVSELLNDSRTLHTQLNHTSEAHAGSLKQMIKDYLVGTTATTMAQTLAALSASIDSADVQGNLQTAIQQVKNDVSGETDTISRTLSAIKTTLTGHVAAASQEDADIDTLINTAKNSLGVTRTGAAMALTYDTSGVGGALLSGASLYAQDTVLDGKVQDETDRLAAMIGSANVAGIDFGTTSTMMSTTTTATFRGPVSFAPGQDCEFRVPVYDSAATLNAIAVPMTGEVVYLNAASASFAAAGPFTENKKFYFYEGTSWFMSPFYSE